ncbi:MAG: O-antigen polymerase, partial [Acidimicrobiia bacterium]
IRDDLVFFGVDIGSRVDDAMLLALLGASAFVVGHEAVLGKRLSARVPRVSSAWSPSRALTGACIAAGLGTAFLVAFLLSIDGVSGVRLFLGGRSAELDALMRDSPLFLWWLSLLVVPAALIAFAVAMTKPRTREVVLAAFLIGLALLRTLPTGSRLNLMVLIGTMVVFVYLHRRRRPGPVALALGLVVALMLSYAFLFFRYAETREDFPSAIKGLASTPEHVVAPVLWGADAEMAPALAGALRVIPSELGYRYGRATLGDLVSRPVPRVVWEGKPLTHTQQVTEAVWPGPRELGGFDPNFTPLMSFFWDFGLLGVVVGLFAYGLLARFAYEYFLRAANDGRVQIAYAAAFWTVVVAARFDPVLLVMHIVVVFVPLLVIFRTSRVRSGAHTVTR